MRIGSKLVLILFLFPFTCLAQVKGKVVSVSDSTSTPSANFSLEKELKDVVVVADMVSRNASKETIFITDSLRKGTVSAIQLLAKLGPLEKVCGYRSTIKILFCPFIKLNNG